MNVNDYSSLYEALDIRINPDDIKTWNQLKNVMEKFGFLKSDKPIKNKKIINTAWDHLKEKSDSMEKREGIVKTRKTRKRRTETLVVPVVWKGKKYDKGATPPSDLPKKPYKFILNRSQKVKQARYTVKINGKWYRKGQFIPTKFKV